MKKIITVLLLSNIFFASCGQTKIKQKNEPTGTNNIKKKVLQSYILEIDGKKLNIAESEILTVGYSPNKQLLITVLSKEKDLQFILRAYMEELKTGTYQIYQCEGGPSKCDDETQEKGQEASLADYPKNPPSDPNLYKVVYNAPTLGLSPLTFIITAVINDEPGMPFHAKRIEGNFSGSLAHLDEKGLDNWEVIGKQVKVDGKFNLYCAIR